MKIAAYSERIYKNERNCSFISSMLEDMNNIKIKLYSDIVNNKISEDKVNITYIQEHFDTNTYFANFVLRSVRDTLESNKKLQEMYINDLEIKVTQKEEEIERNLSKLEFYRNLKKECINYTKNKNAKEKFIFPYNFVKENNVIIIKTSSKKYSLYEFEKLIDIKIKFIKNTLYQNRNRLNRLKQQLNNRKQNIPISCFGSKHLFKLQHSEYKDNHKEWLKLWEQKRHNNFVILGVKNYEGGSMCVRYNFNKKELSVMSHKQGIKKNEKSKYYKQEFFSIPCEFKYNVEQLTKAYIERRTIAYQIIDKGEYFIIMATFDINNDKRINNSLVDGIISIDINVDNFALINISSDGNLLERKVIHFNLEGLSTNQAIKEIEKAVNEVFKYCEERHKPLGREDLKNIQFKSTGDKKKNKTLTQFAYDKIINALDRKFYKNCYAVFKINPSYTSQEGKIKYMAQLGLSVHESASFCIGRRILFSSKKKLYYEDMKKFKQFGSIKSISNKLKKLKFRDFYRLHKIPVNINNYKSLGKYVNDVKKYLQKEELEKQIKKQVEKDLF